MMTITLNQVDILIAIDRSVNHFQTITLVLSKILVDVHRSGSVAFDDFKLNQYNDCY